MPYAPRADGRGYALFPASAGDPAPLEASGKLYCKLVAGVAQLFFQTDLGTVFQITPGGAIAYPFELPDTVTPALTPNTGKLYTKSQGGTSQLFFLDDTGLETQITPVTPAYAYTIWRPSAPSGVGHVQTWAEIEALIAANLGNIIVAIDGNAVIPSTADTECYGKTIFSYYAANLTGSSDITVQDGGRLRHVFAIRTMGIHGAPTVRPFLYYNVPGSLLILREGAQLVLDAGATVSAMELDATFCELAQFEGASCTNNTAPGVSVCTVNAGNTALHAIIALAGTPPPPGYPPNLFSGDASTFLLQIYDASGTPVAQPNFLGAIQPVPMDYAAGIVYQDGLLPALGVATIQGAIDVMKQRTTGAGNTASRPAIPADVATGGSYFDTDLGIPIWSNGLIWVDSAGVAV